MSTTDVVELLGELIAIASVNPMGRDVSGPPFGEARLAEFLEGWFRRRGISVQRQAACAGQDNLLALLPGDPPPERQGPLVLLDAHMDTVPVEGMQIEPFRPEIRQGRVYGRGACDVKGGMAAMLCALARLADLPAARRPTVVMACTVNEEDGFSGAEQLVGCLRGEIAGLPRRPDAAVIAEPTGLDVVTAHKGVVRWRCHARGLAAHSSRPEAGQNAIYRMARALAAIERYQAELSRGPAGSACGPGTISVGTIRGGVSVNTVPDRSTIEIDRRLAPGEDAASARSQLAEYLARDAELASCLEHDPPYLSAPPLSDADNGPLAQRLIQCAREFHPACGKIGVPYATNAAFYAAAGVPTVVFGPGHLAQAHTSDEWIAVDQLQQAEEVYYRFLRSYQSGNDTSPTR